MTYKHYTRWFNYDRDCLHSCLHTNHPGHILTTLYININIDTIIVTVIIPNICEVHGVW